MSKYAVLAAAILLAACGKPAVDETNASVGEVVEAVARSGETARFTPGRWESTVTFVGMEAPGMPAEAVTAMRRIQDKPQSFATCLTPEQAQRPTPDFFAKTSANCRYDHFKMGGGNVDAKLRCSDQNAASEMEMNGRYGPSNYDMAMTTHVAAGGPQGMTMRMKVAAKQVGPCRGDEQKIDGEATGGQ